MTVIVPPVPDEGIGFPPASDATTPLIVTGTLVLKLPAEIVNVAVAIEPLGMTLTLKSAIRQVMDPTGVPKREHDADLGPPTTVTPVTSAGKFMVHCTPVGCAPPVASRDTVNATVEPGVALPELKDSATCCALA
jgi:hypothetical protein